MRIQNDDFVAGTAVRFEPGESKTVTLVPLGGQRIVSGGNGLNSRTSGRLDPADLKSAGFMHQEQTELHIEKLARPYLMTREAYANAYGPTVGDLLRFVMKLKHTAEILGVLFRLGDTNLWVQIEKDFTVYGDECVFGGGKVIREGMGQSNFVGNKDALDLCITNAVIIDHSGIYKVSLFCDGILNDVQFVVG